MKIESIKTHASALALALAETSKQYAQTNGFNLDETKLVLKNAMSAYAFVLVKRGILEGDKQ